MRDNKPCIEESTVLKTSGGLLIGTRDEKISMEHAICMSVKELADYGENSTTIYKNIQDIIRNYQSSSGDTNVYGLINNVNGKLRPGKDIFFQLKDTSILEFSSAVAIIKVVAVLVSINQNLDTIEDMEKQIITFLEREKESEIEADVATLKDILIKYKLNWDNEQFVNSNHKMACDIQRTARKNIISYQKAVTETINERKRFAGNDRINRTLKDLLKKFKYYRLSLYSYGLASMIEVMLSGNYDEKNIAASIKKIRDFSGDYRKLFEKSSILLENLAKGYMRTNVLKGIGAASDKAGKLIGSIPLIKEGPVDEFLQEKGKKIQNSSEDVSKEIVRAFAEVSDPFTWIFIEKMEEMQRTYNDTTEICFDKENIYLIA